MPFPVDLTGILPLKPGMQVERPLSMRGRNLETVMSRHVAGKYAFFVYDKKDNPKRLRHKAENLEGEDVLLFAWKDFLEKFPNIFE